MSTVQYADGLVKLFPVQRFVLKALGGDPLSNTDRIEFTDFYSKRQRSFTECEYLRYLFDEGRASSPEFGPASREILVVGRRTGKSMLHALVAAHSIHRLLKQGEPQARYGLPPTSRIFVTMVTHSKEAASSVCAEVRSLCERTPSIRERMRDSTWSKINFDSSVSFAARTQQARGVRGLGSFHVGIDELAFFDEGGREVHDAVMPSTAAYYPRSAEGAPQGPLESTMFLASTPRYAKDFFHRQYQTAFDKAHWGSTIALRIPTWEMNPSIPMAYYENQQRFMFSDTFARDYGAEFIDE